VGATITGARYVLALAHDRSPRGGAPALTQLIDASSRQEARVIREIKASAVVDVRRWVRLRLGDDASFEQLAKAGIVGRSVPIEVEIEISPAGSAKLTELLEVLLGDGAFPHVGLRTALLAGTGSPLELEVLRLAHSPAVQTPNVCPDTADGQRTLL
jgi:hypothetical protein